MAASTSACALSGMGGVSESISPYVTWMASLMPEEGSPSAQLRLSSSSLLHTVQILMMGQRRVSNPAQLPLLSQTMPQDSLIKTGYQWI